MILQKNTMTKASDVVGLRKNANYHPLSLHLLEFSGQIYSNSSFEFFFDASAYKDKLIYIKPLLVTQLLFKAH